MILSRRVQTRYLQFAIAFSMLLMMTASLAEAGSRRDHKEYDFHYDVRYPGELRSDVGRDKVSEDNADDLKSYNRRTVQWWPKRGMDFIPLADIPGAPLRTWTPRVPSDSLTGTLLDNFPKRPFKAHFVGFRGVGDPFPKDVTDPTSYRCPAVVLRLEDGRKRVFMGKYLSEVPLRFAEVFCRKRIKGAYYKCRDAQAGKIECKLSLDTDECYDCTYKFLFKYEKGVDVALAVQLVLFGGGQGRGPDRIILAAGDGDYVEALRYARREMGKDVQIVTWRRALSRELAKLANKPIIILDDCWEEVCEKKSRPPLDESPADAEPDDEEASSDDTSQSTGQTHESQ